MTQSAESKMIVAVLNDLMFEVKIREAAKRADLEPLLAKTQEQTLAFARWKPRLIILDLNYGAVDPLRLIELLKTDDETGGIPLLGYVSHVQTDLRQAAVERNCDTVVARSTFVTDLPKFLNSLRTPGIDFSAK
jgi:CheY-like chemotaxis protein